MSEMPPPRDPKMLIKEVSAKIKIKDIKRLYDLRDKVAVKWYESGLVALLFVSALTFLVIILKIIPHPEPLVHYFVAGSAVALILIVTAILEFLLRKFHAMRQLYQQQTRLIEDLDKEIKKLREDLAVLGEVLLKENENEREKETPPRPDDPAR
jgi:hypothetical protein